MNQSTCTAGPVGHDIIRWGPVLQFVWKSTDPPDKRYKIIVNVERENEIYFYRRMNYWIRNRCMPKSDTTYEGE
jgi:hypothetical protein